MKKTVIILAAGYGTRFKSNKPKQFHKVNGKTLIDIVIEKYINFEEIIITYNEEYINEYKVENKIKMIKGGKTRKDSLCNALREVTGNVVMIQEVARYNVSDRIINDHINSINDNLFSNTFLESRDTLYKFSENKIVEVGKTNYFQGQGPQMYNLDKIDPNIFNEYYHINNDLDLFTHLLNHNLKPKIIQGDNTANKVTYDGDA